jgi:4'-phosphopantetheinyl transferase
VRDRHGDRGRTRAARIDYVSTVTGHRASMTATVRVQRGSDGPDGVDVWFARTGRLSDPALLERFERLISADERVRRDRFVCAADRELFLQTRGMVRTILSRYTGMRPEDCAFETAPGGRPRLAGEAARAGVDFNVSHTRGLIAIAVARDVRVGIDVEATGRPWSENLPARFFAPAEASALDELPPSGRQVRFYEYWTVKEAYLKARGLGLALPLDGFVVTFPPNAPPAIAFISIDDRPERWQLFLAEPCEGFRLALAIEGAGVPVAIGEYLP